jgi:excinuclease ABC subunit C
MKQNISLKAQVDMLPDFPGVYQYFNSKDEIIYIGKAKSLRKRVASYFTGLNSAPTKIRVLVKNISYLKYIVVSTPEEALLLENNLIKEYQPRYNSMLKDGKTYPSICITKEEFPRIFKTRTIDKEKGEYFGPYSSVWVIDSILDIIHKLYKIRSCSLPLTVQSIQAGKFNLCLEYHIQNCKAPCVGYQSKEDYQQDIDEIRKIIRGETNEISKILMDKMKSLSSEFRFEEAHEMKRKYDLLENFKSKSIVANSIVNNTDVFNYSEDNDFGYVNILRVSNGAIIQGYTVEFKKQLNEPKEDILATAILELREKLNSNSKTIVLPFPIDYDFRNVKTVIPQRGDLKKLLELSLQNVKQYKLDKLKYTEKLNPEQRSIRILTELKDKLHLEKIPFTIDIFDISHISGSDTVAACVVFNKAKPSKKNYRTYNIQTTNGSDDYEAIRETARRRYSRMIEESKPLPDLIVVDGGAGQMGAMHKVIEDELYLKIPIAGIVKNEHHKTRELLFGNPPKEIGIKVNESLFKFLAVIQEEVHRFAISAHRNKRSKKQTSSELDKIPNVGVKTKNLLISHFKSVKRIKLATFEELENLIGTHRATAVYRHFSANLTAPE